MKKRVGAVEEFEFEPLVVVGKQLHVTVAITGWLSKEMPGNYPLNRYVEEILTLYFLLTKHLLVTR